MKIPNKCQFQTAFAFAAVLLSANAVQAQVINFDVPGGVSGFANYSGQGASADSGKNFWNAIVENGTTSSCKLDDGSTTSPITLTVSSDSVYTAGGQGTQGTPSGLQSPFYDSKPGPKTCTLANVPAGTYNLYLYGINGDSADCNRGTTFTVGSSSLSTVNTTAAYNTFIQGNDYVIFSNIVVGSGGGSIVFTYKANTAVSGNTIGNFNGLQLVTASGGSGPPSSVVNVDYSISEHAANQIAGGILHSVFTTEPSRYLDDGMKFSNIRGSGTAGLPNGPDLFDPATYAVNTQSGTAGTHLMVGPYYYQAAEGSTPYWPGDNGNYSTWQSIITTLVNAATTGNFTVFSYPTWNEPDIEWTGTDSAGQTLNTAGFEQAHKIAYQTLKGISSSIKVQAPEASGFNASWIEGFLTYCKANNCLPDVLTWHTYNRQSDDTTPNITTQAQTLYSWMQTNGITPMPMAVTEYDGGNWAGSTDNPYNEGHNTGNTFMYIMYIENAIPYGMMGGVRADWWMGFSGNPNYKSALSDLADTRTTPQYTRPTGSWWLYNAYRDQTGEVVSSTPTVTPDIGCFATSDSTMKRSILLIANQNQTNTDAMSVTLNNLQDASYLENAGKIHVRVDLIGNGTNITSITNVSEADYTVTNNYVVLSLPSLAAQNAYKITITSATSADTTTTYQVGSLTPTYSSGVTYSLSANHNGTANAAGQLDATAPGQFVTYTINVPTAGVYKLDAWLKTNNNRGIAVLYYNGQTAQSQGSPKDEYSSAANFYLTDFGNINVPTAGNITLQFVAAANNSASSSYYMFFDSFILTKL